MDDGTQVSKYLLEPAFLRELYLFELATTIALMQENMLTNDASSLSGRRIRDLSMEDFETSPARGSKEMGCSNWGSAGKGTRKHRKRQELSKQTYKDDF